MIKLSETDYQALRVGAKVLEEDGFGDKVLLLKNGKMLKLFRIKHFFSSAKLFPYARRFYKNAARLEALGIRTLKPLTLYRLSARRLDAVLYEPLPGKTVKEICRDNPEKIDGVFIDKLAAYMESLHVLGIFFRSLHLGNIVVDDEGHFGLIDIADMRIFPQPLSSGRRLRNFSHLTRMKSYSEPVSSQSDRLLEAYLKNFKAATSQFKNELQQQLLSW